MEILKCFKQFFKYFKEEKKPFAIYSAISLIAALLELCGVALTYPFIVKILSNSTSPDWKNSPLIIGLVILLMFLLKNIFMIAYTYIQTRYTTHLGVKIQRRFIRYFLGANYQESSKISLAQKNKILSFLTDSTVNEFILRLLNLSVNIFIFIFISACLAIKFPFATFTAVIFGITILYIQTKVFKPYIKKISDNLSNATLSYNQAANDALLNIKAVKVSNNEKYFYDNFQNTLTDYCKNRYKTSFVSSIPPYITEPFAILLLFVLVGIISGQNYTDPVKLVASLALVGAAVFRLTPAISRIQVNINGINSTMPLTKEFLEIYETLGVNNIPEITQKDYVKFNQSLELKNINFGYAKDKPILENINLKISKGDFIGISGASGTGKTTLVDIIAGLYKPDSGEILVDGKIQDKPLKIGYVPQEFIIIKGNIRENVAFGNAVINDEKVIDSLKKAQLFDFIEENLKEGIYADPFVDSTGFSQGQKQRLAIARALYSEPDILILDEATSALDSKTEDEICHVLNELKGDKTIIVIAHRLSTIKSTNKIFYMKNGTVSLFDNDDNFLKASEKFKNSDKPSVDK